MPFVNQSRPWTIEVPIQSDCDPFFLPRALQTIDIQVCVVFFVLHSFDGLGIMRWTSMTSRCLAKNYGENTL